MKLRIVEIPQILKQLPYDLGFFLADQLLILLILRLLDEGSLEVYHYDLNLDHNLCQQSHKQIKDWRLLITKLIQIYSQHSGLLFQDCLRYKTIDNHLNLVEDLLPAEVIVLLRLQTQCELGLHGVN